LRCINISKDVTFSPGVYYIQDGDLTVSGSANITANNVTFLITGASSNSQYHHQRDTDDVRRTLLRPMVWVSVYYDQPSAVNNKKSGKAGANWIKNATLNGSGIIYLVNQTLNIQKTARS